jgi:hypothetical protein
MKSMCFSISLLAALALTFSMAVHAEAQTFSKHAPSGLRQLAELTASDGGGIADDFGYSIAMSGDTIVVGAPYAHDTGAVYVFVKPAGGWASMTETAELTASDGYPNVDFGLSVGISGNTIVAGSYSHNAAYVFTRPQSGWQNITEAAVLSKRYSLRKTFL